MKLRLCHDLEATLKHQSNLDKAVYPSEAAVRSAAAPWGAAIPWDPCAGGPRRHGPEPPAKAVFSARLAPAGALPDPTVRLRVDDATEWSSPLTLPASQGSGRLRGPALGFASAADAARGADAATARLSLRGANPDREGRRACYEIGLRVSPAPRDGAPVRCLVAPRVAVKNALSCALELRQAGADAAEPLLELPPNATGHVTWTDAEKPRLVVLRARFSDGAMRVSGPVRVDGGGRRGETVFSMASPASDAVNAPKLVRVRREPRAVLVDTAGEPVARKGAGGFAETLAIVEAADDRWPPHRSRADVLRRSSLFRSSREGRRRAYQAGSARRRG